MPADNRREPCHDSQLLPADPEKQEPNITKLGSIGNSTMSSSPCVLRRTASTGFGRAKVRVLLTTNELRKEQDLVILWKYYDR